MRFRLIVVCAAVLAVGLARPACAAEQFALVTGEDYPPFADPRLPGGGLATILVRQVVAALGATARVDFLPWRRGYEDTLRGRYDGTFPYVRTPEREREFLYSEPLIHLRQVVFVAAGRSFAYRKPDDLRGRRACVALGYAPPRELGTLIDQKLVERLTPGSAAMCPAMVDAGRADFFIQDERIGAALVARMGLAGAVVAIPDPPFGISDLYFLVPRSRPDAAGLMKRFNAGLEQLRASGGYERLLLE